MDADRASELLARNDSGVRAVIVDLDLIESSNSLRDARSRSRGVPWIVLSDLAAEEVADRLAIVGASGFLSKPFEPGKLLSLLDGLLREYGFDSSAEVRRR